jgi:hypothetical protein
MIVKKIDTSLSLVKPFESQPPSRLGQQMNLATEGRYVYWDWWWLDDYNRSHGGIARMWQNGTHRQMRFIGASPHGRVRRAGGGAR